MKQFIVLSAILPFLLIFVLQYSLEQQNHYRLAFLQQAVYEAKEQAKQDGYFTKENTNMLKKKISEKFQINQNAISIEATSVPKYRVNYFDERELIYYKVEVPIEEVMAGAAFFGIKDNQAMFRIENYTASERIKR